ncbi:Uncharacterised protein [uncultured archaeon]|nr:Uncharacterised protein [uncultured archaeon]
MSERQAHERNRRWANRWMSLYFMLVSSRPLIAGRPRNTPDEKSAHKALAETHDEIRRLVESLWRLPSCGVCKNCCFFNNDYGVPIETQNVFHIVEFLKFKNLSPEDYLASKRFSDLPLVEKKRFDEERRSHYTTETDGEKRMVYSRLNDRWKASAQQLSTLPQNLGNKHMWLRQGAKACAFLTEKGCLLYRKANIYPYVCQHYVCQTGYVRRLLKELGVPEGQPSDDIRLHNEAAEIAIEKIFGNEEFTTTSGNLYAAVDALIVAYVNGHTLSIPLAHYRTALREYDEAKKRIIKNLAYAMPSLTQNKI